MMLLAWAATIVVLAFVAERYSIWAAGVLVMTIAWGSNFFS